MTSESRKLGVEGGNVLSKLGFLLALLLIAAAVYLIVTWTGVENL